MAELSDRMRERVQPHLRGIEPYDPNFTPTKINLSANENTYPLPFGVRERVDAALAATPLNRYPDPMSNSLRDELARRHGVARENICVGNGGDELLFNLLFAFGGCGRTMLTCTPAFSEYQFFADLTQTSVLDIPRDPVTFEVDAARVLDAASSCDVVVLTSPNNPTGNLIDPALTREMCRACPGVVLLDEAYMEFADASASALGLLDECSNLVVLRTLSKAFGAAGIRCGYVVAASDIIDAFAAIRQIYSVNVLTQAAALEMVKQRERFSSTVATICSERDRMYAALSEDPRVTVWSSAANFLLVRMASASTVRRRLRDEFSILVRDFSAAAGLEGCLRITVGTPQENDAVLAALDSLLREE